MSSDGAEVLVDGLGLLVDVEDGFVVGAVIAGPVLVAPVGLSASTETALSVGRGAVVVAVADVVSVGLLVGAVVVVVAVTVAIGLLSTLPLSKIAFATNAPMPAMTSARTPRPMKRGARLFCGTA
jgi:hypothetical protein